MTANPPRPKSPPKTLTRINRETLQSKVYDELKRGLMGGAFKPGEAVTLRRLAEVFGTSIMPVREAVNRLIAEGALKSEPNRSVIVPLMHRVRFADLTEARAALESILTRRACSLITPEQLVELDAINARLMESIARGEMIESLRHNRDFHFYIYRAAQSEVLIQMVESVWMQVGPFLFFTTDRPRTNWTAVHHQEFLQAVRDRAPERATAAIQRDIEETAARLLATDVFGPT